MGRRIKPHYYNKKPFLLGLRLVVVSLGLLLVVFLSLAGCPNPLNSLRKFIESSGIAVKIDGMTITEVCDLGRVKEGETYSFVVTVLNSGNVDLSLIGNPPVISDNPKFAISGQPDNVVKVRGNTAFTVTFTTSGVYDKESKAKLSIINNSQKGDFSFDLTAFVDASAPSVETRFPASTNVPTNVVLSVKFSEEMNPSSISDTTFTVRKIGGVNVGASVKYDAALRTATLDPTTNLDAITEYQVQLTTDIQDLVGFSLIPLSTPWKFTTGAGSDMEAPQVVSTVPLDGATGVATTTFITITFSEELNPSTINPDSFRLFKSNIQIAGTAGYNPTNKTASFDPTDDLTLGTLYTAYLSPGIKDTSGNATTAPHMWSFTTTQGAVAPFVLARSPADNAAGAAINTMISAEFSEPMDPSSLTTSTFYLDPAAAGSVSYNPASRTATFDPTSDLAPTITYTAFLTAGIKDVGGTPLASQYWIFQTGAAPDTDPPAVSGISPADVATNVLLAANITATFDESMDPVTINGTTFQLLKGGSPVAGTVSYSESTKTATLDPTSLLDVTIVYAAKITTGVKDAGGNNMLLDKVWSFTTEAGTSPATVVSVAPINGAVDVDVSTTITVEFSKMMNAATITTSTFKLSISDVPVAGTVSYDPATRKAIFTPGSALENEKSYKAECTAGIKDIGGNALTPFASQFSTVAANKWDSMRWGIGKWGP
jgi:methionine-rich copper-binding protein CopC